MALRVFTAIVLAHWGEHLLQGFQIYALGWPVPEAPGVGGYFFPGVWQSETLPSWYAGRGFKGVVDGRWWAIAVAIQFFHPIDPLLLILQASTGYYLAGSPVPTSL